MPTPKKIKLAVLISGQGRTLKNLLDAIDAGRLNAEIPIVISSSPNAGGLQYAEKYNIPIEIVESADMTAEEFNHKIFSACNFYGVDYVVLAGFLKFLTIPKEYHLRVLNIHPSLIPSFCGEGKFGRRVHEEALRRGVKVSGCTVHFADNEYDHGPIILQEVVPVLEDDDVEKLSDRVLFDAEFVAYPKALQLLAEGRVEVVEVPHEQRFVVKILPPEDER